MSVVAKDMLFATLDPTMRRMVLPSGQEVVLCDTVGFISNLPTELVASFRATLEEVVEADLVLHVQDASSGEALEERHTVEAIVQKIVDDRPIRMIDIFNKIDLVGEGWCGYQSEYYSRNGAICVSAVTGDGIDALFNVLVSKFDALRHVVIYDIPSTDGSALAWLYKNGDVISSEPQDMSSIVAALQLPDTVLCAPI